MPTSTSERTLILLRHAKADAPSPTADYQRPLIARGLADATAAGRWIAGQGYAPGLVFCSPARRTKETWLRVEPSLPKPPEVRFVEEMYAGGPWELLELLRGVPPEVGQVLVIGHNPTLELLAALLDPERGGKMAKAALSVHRQAGPWLDLGARTAPVVAAHVARAA